MPEQARSQVIPFPQRRASTPAATVSGEGANLARALASLNAALVDQRAAIAAWRLSLTELRRSTQSLSEGLLRYQGNLGTLGTRVAALRQEATRLETWADKVVASQP